jgi:4-hydroxy 2-oxovalerate aldolase
MRNVKILDCTLRDGGRIIDCAFDDRATAQIIEKLTRANVDIVEVGFLRDAGSVRYEGNSTFFTDVGQIEPFIPANRADTEYAAFIDFGMFDFDALREYDGRSISVIRVGFTKKDYCAQYGALVDAFKAAQGKGYKLFIQGVNLLNYSDKEVLDIVEMVNETKPASFGIVDTYGAMYVDDVARLYGLIDHNLHKNIAIDFHSHNNFQLSFSFAQKVVGLSNGVREVIIDATLSGMGKGAGNLNTELIADFLARKMAYGYDTDVIFDAIDEHIYDLRQKYRWGYSPAALLSGIYKSHPNNVIYLTDKFRLNTKDIKNILSMIDAQERQRYDYDKMDLLIEEYNGSKHDDHAEIARLAADFSDKPVLTLVPGASITTHRSAIDKFVDDNVPAIISVNFAADYPKAYAFFANKKRYASYRQNGRPVIVTSDVATGAPDEIIVNYHSLLNRGYKLFDNSVLMLLNLLKKLRVKEIAIAGMDGFSKNQGDNYFDATLNVGRLNDQLDDINNEISEMLERYLAAIKGVCNVSLITPSVFEKLFN